MNAGSIECSRTCESYKPADVMGVCCGGGTTGGLLHPPGCHGDGQMR